MVAMFVSKANAERREGSSPFPRTEYKFVMEIEKGITSLRPRCEEIFYMLSAELEREQAEKLTNKMMESILEAEIKLHEDFINICNKNIDREKIKMPKHWLDFDNSFERGIRKGTIIANEARLKSHEDSIETAKQHIEILKYNLL